MLTFSKSVLSIATAGVLLASAPAQAELIYGLTTDNNLFSFDSATPGTILSGQFVTGLAMNESLVGIDIQPTSGTIFGVGSSSRLYTINPGTGVATAVAGAFTPTLNGTSFDIDFNPTGGAAAIRVVSDADQNLAVNAAAGTAAGQSNINAPYGNPNLAGLAYGNNVSGAATTSLFSIDAGADLLNSSTAPFTSGTQAVISNLKDAALLNLDVTGLLGFDISGSGAAFVAIQQGGNGYSQFSSINLTNGQISGVSAGNSITGLIGGGLFVRDITVAAVPEPTTLGLAGIAAMGLIARRRKA